MDGSAVFSRYFTGKPSSVSEYDSTRSETDKRITWVVKTDLGECAAIKAASNCFTTAERIESWAKLTQLYNTLGIRAPMILTDKTSGKSSYFTCDGVNYVIYAEEEKPFRTAYEYCGGEPEESFWLEDEICATAKVAAFPRELPPWPTAYCLYEPFCADDATDETTDCAVKFLNAAKCAFPELSERAENIFSRFSELYKSLEKDYLRLPSAFFQGDLNSTNVLIDDKGSFAGVIDFNLSGREIILNYLYREFCDLSPRKSDVGRLCEPDLLARQDEALCKGVQIVEKYYPFNAAEKAVFPKYLRMLVPFEWPAFSLFLSVLRDCDKKTASDILSWIEYRQNRDYPLF